MKAFSRLLVVTGATVSSLLLGAGASHASLDNEQSLADGQDRTLTVQQWDTFLNGVFPMDHNRLTREWFHSGRAKYSCAGKACDEFAGTLELGYQIGFPWSLGVGINFAYTTPNILLDNVTPETFFPGIGIGNRWGGVITPNLFPGASISADLGNGPGVQEVATFSVDVSGPAGGVAVANAHGTVTGAAGGVMVRPFARLIAKTGDSVTTYGEPWNMN
ncbi:MspA family porin [Mycolicibacterium mucogenicum]|uniref:Porin MspA n=2 Tax=Mycobacteriaceae TaxID=1762 RepID=A0ABN5Z278_9MYCO|nr:MULTISPECIES: MspA family porin [Mycolicibacterium]MCX8564710.1 MspA family porin [Mycolicibacterium mucogenicum]TLH62726.1 porin [Mycolicibacterium aubagnense]BBX88103.1 porin MspA [Mycolicibacterium aubagnense]